MALTSSYSIEQAQVDGRKWVNEKHIDVIAVEHFNSYLSTDSMDKDAILAVHAAEIEKNLKDQEARTSLNEMKYTAVYASQSNFILSIREKYRLSESEDTAQIAKWILSNSDAEADIRTAFGMDFIQWNTFKIKLQSFADALKTIENAKGE